MKTLITSRRFAMALLAAGALAVGSLVSTAASADVTLEFVTWNYSIDTIKDNIAKFEAENPGITVNHTDYPWLQYHDTIVLRLRGSTTTDILYVGEDWLPEWAAAGWLAPLEDLFPEVAQYKDKTVRYALRDMTYQDKLYGLSH